MPSGRSEHSRADRGPGSPGQASVELIATIPALLLAAVIAVQIALAGHALWSAGVAARAGARAALVGSDTGAVARAALPAYLRGGSSVTGTASVRVSVRVPSLLPGVPRLSVDGRSSLGPAGG